VKTYVGYRRSPPDVATLRSQHPGGVFVDVPGGTYNGEGSYFWSSVKTEAKSLAKYQLFQAAFRLAFRSRR